MTDSNQDIDHRTKTGIHNLDKILCGGIPAGSLVVIAGTPGAGKTIFSQQVIFHNATPEHPALFFNTLSEPTAKTLKYGKKFNFFDQEKLNNNSIEFVDLGSLTRSDGLEKGVSIFMEHVKRIKPRYVVIDSFKVFEDLASTNEILRKFSYEIATNLMAWECTAFLLGEFGDDDLQTNPLFSIVDGIITLKRHEEAREQQRFLRILKMRGTDHGQNAYHFSISDNGIKVYAPEITWHEEAHENSIHAIDSRIKTGISQFDSLLGTGIPVGSSLLICGAAGTGKTLLSLEYIYRGAKEFNEKGIYFTFDESKERLIASAKNMGWDLEHEINRGLIKIVYFPMINLHIEKHLSMIDDDIQEFQAKRVVVDSLSMLLRKIKNLVLVQERVFQFSTMIRKNRCVAFFTMDIPYGVLQISQLGVEEIAVDGVIVLTTQQVNLERTRFLEVYKLRNTQHAHGLHPMSISPNGVMITPRT